MPAIADPLRDDDFFRRYLSNVALIGLCISAVVLHIDLGVDRSSASTDALENIAAICLAKVPDFAGSLERSEFRFQRGGWVDTTGHFPVDRQSAGLQPIGPFTVGPN